MPANYSRVDVKFSRQNREKLEKFKKEASDISGRSISMSEVIDSIVEQFFDKEEATKRIPEHLKNLNEWLNQHTNTTKG